MVDRPSTARAPGLSVRARLTLSYAGFLLLAGALLLTAVWLYLLRYVPNRATLIDADPDSINGVFPVRSNLQATFLPRALVVMLVLLVVGLVGGWFLAGRVLAPLEQITEATRRASAGSLSHRIELPGRADEFRELADAFDAMLARLDAHVAEQQRFASNASHELRTPLAITQALLEVARADPDRDVDALLARLQAVNARSIDLTEALLTLSRAGHGALPWEPVDLSLLAEEAAETLVPAAEARGVAVEVTGDPAPTEGSRALLLQMASNLVHNAVVHNRPDGGTVWVATSSAAGASTLRVANTGPVLTAEVVATLAEPFQRGAERTRTGDEGVGLGLAIVDRIVDAHGGRLALRARPEGGLEAVVTLPAAEG